MHPLSLSDSELQQVFDAAKTLPLEKRNLFLQRVAATLTVHRVNLDKCNADALQGLRHGPQPLAAPRQTAPVADRPTIAPHRCDRAN